MCLEFHFAEYVHHRLSSLVYNTFFNTKPANGTDSSMFSEEYKCCVWVVGVYMDR